MTEVAADVSSAVESRRPAARKERWKMSAVMELIQHGG